MNNEPFLQKQQQQIQTSINWIIQWFFSQIYRQSFERFMTAHILKMDTRYQHMGHFKWHFFRNHQPFEKKLNKNIELFYEYDKKGT